MSRYAFLAVELMRAGKRALTYDLTYSYIGQQIINASFTNQQLTQFAIEQAFNSPLGFDIVTYMLVALGMHVLIFEDMTAELRQANHQLETAQGELREMAVTDPLTRCRNRRFFEEVIGPQVRPVGEHRASRSSFKLHHGIRKRGEEAGPSEPTDVELLVEIRDLLRNQQNRAD